MKFEYDKSAFKKTMKRSIILIVVYLTFVIQSFAQIGLSTSMFKGKDAKLIESNWSTESRLFIPVGFPIKIKDSTKAFILFRPTIRMEWYNFENNLIVNRQNGYSTFLMDTEANHIYEDKFLKKSSVMNSSSFFMPINVLLELEKSKSLLIAPGFYLEYLMGGKFIRKYDDGSPKLVINKFKDDIDYYGFQRFQYGLNVYISYKFIAINGTYSFTNLFKPSEGIVASRTNIGFIINLYWKNGIIIF